MKDPLAQARVTRIAQWIAPVLVLGIAAVLRFWALGRPGSLVFDELYYVRDAISQLAHGFPTSWPDDDPAMGGGRATDFTDEASYAVHPPLGKWLIGLGILVFGPESGWGWRSAVAVAGVLTVALTMRLGWLLSRNMMIACVAGLLLAIDGVHATLTRVGLLDGFLALFIALGALFVWRDQLAMTRTYRMQLVPISWWRPWLIAAALAFGAGAAVKWSGLYPLGFFLIFVTVRDLIARLRSGRSGQTLRAVAQASVAAILTLPVAAAVYVASWIGWILTAGGWGRTPGVPWWQALIEYHRDMFEWHSTLTAPHPFQSAPLEWPFAWKPTAMYEVRWTDGCPWHECVSGITPLPNPIVTWGGVFALCVLLWLVLTAAVRALRLRRAAGGVAANTDGVPRTGSNATTDRFDGGTRLVRSRRLVLSSSGVLVAAFVLTGYLSGWLPWVLTFSRSAVFQFYAVVLTPFSALALALVLGLICGIPLGLRGARSAEETASAAQLPDPRTLLGRRLAVAVFLITALVLAVFFFPVGSGMPVSDWFWKSHMWLPEWS